MGAFNGGRTHDLHITSQMCNPLRHAAPTDSFVTAKLTENVDEGF